VPQKDTQHADTISTDASSEEHSSFNTKSNMLDCGNCIINCHSLLSVAKYENYATLIVNPGLACYLVRHINIPGLFCFVSSSSWKKLCENEDTSLLPPTIFKGAIVASYVDYGEAWEMISSSSPPLTLVALDGLFLKKATNSNKWVPMIIGHDTNIPEFTRDSSLESEISIWHILDIYKLLSYEMDSSVVQLLNFVCECIWIEDGNELTENLMHAFRNLDAPDVPERNDAKLAKRHRIKQSAARIRDIMLTILAQISSKQIRRSEDVIKQAFHSAFKQIDRSKLETFILKSMSRVNQIKSILNSEFGLDIFFGKQAVAQITNWW
jgi:hypothetical protein